MAENKYTTENGYTLSQSGNSIQDLFNLLIDIDKEQAGKLLAVSKLKDADDKPTLTFVDSVSGVETSPEVYIGSGDMPEGYVLQIDPTGEADDVPNHSCVYVGPGEPPDGYILALDPTSGPDNIVRAVNGQTPDENGNVEIEVGGSADIPRIETSEEVVIIEPNKFYVFPEMRYLDVTFDLTHSDASIVQEYKFRFTSGATATTLTLPLEIKGDITVNANSVIEISVVDGYAVSQSWAVSE